MKTVKRISFVLLVTLTGACGSITSDTAEDVRNNNFSTEASQSQGTSEEDDEGQDEPTATKETDDGRDEDKVPAPSENASKHGVTEHTSMKTNLIAKTENGDILRAKNAPKELPEPGHEQGSDGSSSKDVNISLLRLGSDGKVEK